MMKLFQVKITYIYIIASSCMMVEFNHQFVVVEW